MFTAILYYCYRLLLTTPFDLSLNLLRWVKTIYMFVVIALVVLPLIIWDDKLFEKDVDDFKVQLSRWYPIVFAVMMSIAAIVIFLFRNSSIFSRIVSALVVIVVLFAIFFYMQLAEAYRNNIPVLSILPLFVWKEVCAVILLIAIPFGIIATIISPILKIARFLLTSLLHILGMPIYKPEWKYIPLVEVVKMFCWNSNLQSPSATADGLFSFYFLLSF